ncbi:MAG: carboxylating nicotinate-nucleotide diphosphorylase [Gammaproteobacteria bacterium]
MSDPDALHPELVSDAVKRALDEDCGAGDLTAELIPSEATVVADVLVREDIVLCGSDWFEEVFHQLDPGIQLQWRARDGDAVSGGSRVCNLKGTARPILTGERTALNFLQMLSGTATLTREYVSAVAGTDVTILDTRKTIPGLRLAQKYAVRCGGGKNHRKGLYDAILIKENHIAAAGGIAPAVSAARKHQVLVEVEAETLKQVGDALDAGADRILLDNFSTDQLLQAVQLRNSHSADQTKLEASGGIRIEGIREIAATGVDFISVGALTKNVVAADFSLRFL